MYKGLRVFNINSEVTCIDLVSERNFQHLGPPSWSAVALQRNGIPTHHLQFVTSFSSAKEDEEELKEDDENLEEKKVVLEDS